MGREVTSVSGTVQAQQALLLVNVLIKTKQKKINGSLGLCGHSFCDPITRGQP